MTSKAKTGSMEDEQPAMREIVPVGAMVKTVAFHLRPPVGRLGDVGETPPLFAEGARGRRRLGQKEGGDLLGHGDGPRRVVLDLHEEKEVGQAHDPESDPAVGPGHLVDLRQGVLVDVDDVVEEADGDADGLPEAVPVEAVLPARGEEVGEVDGAEVAGFELVEGLLAAGVRRPDGSDPGGGIGLVDPVDEDQARVADRPGRLDHHLKDRPGLARARGLPRPGIDEVVGAALPDGLHEGVGGRNGDVEVRNAPAVELHLDEFLDVGMVDPEDAHVGPAPGPALLDRFGRGVDDLEEGDGAGGDALGLADEAPLGPEPAEVEARPSALLVDEGRVLDRLEDRVEGILDGQDEAGAEAHVPAGSGQGRAVGQEIAGQHEPDEFVLVFLLGGLALLGGGDVAGHPAEEVLRRLIQDLPFFVAQEVTGLENPQGVGTESV